MKIHIIIAPTCFGLRPSSGSLYRAWLSYTSVKTFSKITSFIFVQTVSAQQTAHTSFHEMLPNLHTIYNDVILLNVLSEV